MRLDLDIHKHIKGVLKMDIQKLKEIEALASINRNEQNILSSSGFLSAEFLDQYATMCHNVWALIKGILQFNIVVGIDEKKLEQIKDLMGSEPWHGSEMFFNKNHKLKKVYVNHVRKKHRIVKKFILKVFSIVCVSEHYSEISKQFIDLDPNIVK